MSMDNLAGRVEIRRYTGRIDSAQLQRIAAYSAIFLLALVTRLTIYGYGLPYVENVDEPNMYLLANDWRGKLDAGYRTEWLAGYPPGYIWLSGAIMDVVDQVVTLNIHTDMGVYIRVLRLASVAADLVTLGAIMLLARWLVSHSAALLVGALWALAAPVAFNATAAVPDSFAVMFCALCALGSLASIHFDNAATALLATGAGLLAVTFKYPVFPVLLLPALSCLVQVWRHRRFVTAGLALAMVLAAAYGLLVVYGAQGLGNREAEAVRYSLLDNMLNITRWRNALAAVGQTTGTGLLLVTGLALVTPAIRRRRPAGWPLILSLFVTGALLFALVPGFTRADTIYATRYTWPASLCLIVSSALVIDQAFSFKRWPFVRWAAAAVALVWLVPATAAQINDMTRTDTRTVAQAWFENNVPDGAPVWTEQYLVYRSLSRYEAGYSGYKTFGTVLGPDDPTWHGTFADIDYVFLDQAGLKTWPSIDTFPQLDGLTLLKHIGGDSLRGPDLYIYSTQPPPSEPPVVFSAGDTKLALRRLQVTQSTEQIEAESLWQATGQPPTHDYSYFLHLTPLDEPSNILAQHDGPLGENRPTSSWTDPEESLIVSLGPLALPPLPPGEYVVSFGVYFWQTGEPLALADGQTALEMTRFTIK